ncbi:MAG: hypothetical protein ABGY96_19735 [bacterium]|nr:hypothetical protein [Gammaproteobacteria bacterium]
MTELEPDRQRNISRNRIHLSLLFGIGLMPVFIAFIVYVNFPQLLPTETTNQGRLIIPPISNTRLDLSLADSKWSLLMPVGQTCDPDCKQRFYLARQTNVALGKESERVKRILLTTQQTPEIQISDLLREYPDMGQIQLDESLLRDTFRDVVPDSVSGNYIFLMDPHGNVMMVYTLEKMGGPLLKDLKHLLKLSNIG